MAKESQTYGFFHIGGGAPDGASLFIKNTEVSVMNFMGDFDETDDFLDDEVDDFQRMHSEIMEEVDEKNQRVLKHFFGRINYKGIVGYENSTGNKLFTVWTDRPGIIIGKGGDNIKILKEILKEEFNYDYEVGIKEIRGRMMVIL